MHVNTKGLSYGEIYKVRYQHGIMYAKVKLLRWCTDEMDFITNWARISIPHGTHNYGIWTSPHPREKVWVAFEGGDPQRPVIVGYAPVKAQSSEMPPEFGNEDHADKSPVGDRELPSDQCLPEPPCRELYSHTPCSADPADESEQEEFADDPCGGCCKGMGDCGASESEMAELLDEADAFNSGCSGAIRGAVASACGVDPSKVDLESACKACARGSKAGAGFAKGVAEKALDACKDAVSALIPNGWADTIFGLIGGVLGLGE